MMCVVNFVLPFSHLQGVEWGWPGRREPDDDTSRLRRGGEDSSFFKFGFTRIGTPM